MEQQRRSDPVVTRTEFRGVTNSLGLLWKRSRKHTMWLLSYRSTAVVSVIAAAVSVLAAIAAWMR